MLQELHFELTPEAANPKKMKSQPKADWRNQIGGVFVIALLMLGSCGGPSKTASPRADKVPPMPIVTVFVPMNEEFCRAVQMNTLFPFQKDRSQIWDSGLVFVNGTDQQTAYKLHLINAGHRTASGLPIDAGVKLITNYIVRRVETQITNDWQFDLTSFRFNSPLTQLVFRSNVVIHLTTPTSSANQWSSGTLSNWPEIVATPEYKRLRTTHFFDERAGR